jgi:hypothetical protein
VSRRVLAGLLAAAVVAADLAVPAASAQAAPAPWKPAVQQEKSVPGQNFTPKTAKAAAANASVVRTPAKVDWPAAGAADVTLGAARTRAGGLPVYLSRPGGGKATVEVLDRAATERAGVDGLLFRV